MGGAGNPKGAANSQLQCGNLFWGDAKKEHSYMDDIVFKLGGGIFASGRCNLKVFNGNVELGVFAVNEEDLFRIQCALIWSR